MWEEIWESYGGRLLGVAAGVFFGMLYLFIGLWDMLFFALLLFIGYYVGKQRDLKLGPLFPWQKMGIWMFERWRRLK